MTGRMSCLEVRSRGSAWPACSTTGEHYSAFHGHSVIWNQERENGCSQSVEELHGGASPLLPVQQGHGSQVAGHSQEVGHWWVTHSFPLHPLPP